MRRFSLAVTGYVVACLVLAIVIVLHGDGPHPRIVSIYPASGDRYWPGGIAQITFSQPMSHSSVQSALQVSPPGQGQEIWYGNTLNLQPLDDWKPNTTYRFLLTGSVTDTLGRPLHTPVSFWFHVFRVTHLYTCLYRGIRNVCAGSGPSRHYVTRAATPVLQFALSPDDTLLAFTRRDASGLPHLFLIQVDGTGLRQLTRGAYADSSPLWAPGDSNDVSYTRRPVIRTGSGTRLGRPRLWNVQTDGQDNAPL